MATQDLLLAALSKQGEKFMEMFEDSGSRKKQKVVHQLEAVEPKLPETDANEGTDSEPEEEPEEKTAAFQAAKQTVVQLGSRKASRQQPSGAKGGSTAGNEKKREKRMFMSGRADLFHDQAASRSTAATLGNQNGASKAGGAELRELHDEITSFGAIGLGKAQQRSIENARLLKLHAKVEKRRRMPANLGRAIAAKEKEKEKKALQEAIDQNMIQKAGSGKKMRQQAALERRRSSIGLNEDGGAFKAGVLDVRKLPGGNSRKHRQPRKKRA